MIALSSTEAEFYALVSCTAQSMAEQATARDLGLQLSVRIMMDATAGIAIASRRGLGKVRHVDAQFLWVQEVIQNGKIKIRRKHTSEMLADVMTKDCGLAADALRAAVSHGRYTLGSETEILEWRAQAKAERLERGRARAAEAELKTELEGKLKKVNRAKVTDRQPRETNILELWN